MGVAWQWHSVTTHEGDLAMMKVVNMDLIQDAYCLSLSFRLAKALNILVPPSPPSRGLHSQSSWS